MIVRWFQSSITFPVSLLFFTLHVCCISVVFPYFQISSPPFSIAFLSPHIAMSINRQVPLFITDYDVRFIIRDGYVSFHLLIVQYGYVTLVTSFY